MYFSLKSFAILLLVITFLLIVVIASSLALVEYAKSGADWVSALIPTLGNITGGIIGGIVAYLVAKYQIEKQLNAQDKSRKSAVCIRMKLIKEELIDNKDLLKTIIENLKAGQAFNVEKFIDELSVKMWENSINYIDVSDEMLKNLSLIYREICIVKKCKGDEVADILNELIERIDRVIEMVEKYNKWFEV